MLIDDHLLRDLLVGQGREALHASGPGPVATTGLWLFRLCSSFARPEVTGRLSAPVAHLHPDAQIGFRRALMRVAADVEILSLRDLAWSMAELQAEHGRAGRRLSTLSAEALAAAHRLQTGIAVSRRDVGPGLQAAAAADGVPFHVI